MDRCAGAIWNQGWPVETNRCQAAFQSLQYSLLLQKNKAIVPNLMFLSALAAPYYRVSANVIIYQPQPGKVVKRKKYLFPQWISILIWFECSIICMDDRSVCVFEWQKLKSFPMCYATIPKTSRHQFGSPWEKNEHEMHVAPWIFSMFYLFKCFCMNRFKCFCIYTVFIHIKMFSCIQA